MSVEDKLIWSYLGYITLMFVWLVILWSGTAYVVFVMGRSGWWFALTLIMSCPISPAKWHGIITGREPKCDNCS